jgi:signal transduction histidine kinase
MHKLLFILLLTLPLVAQAQTDNEKEFQQMEEEIASGKLSDDEVFERYKILSSSFKVGFEKAIDNSRKAIAFAHEKKNEEQEINYSTHMGDLYSTSNIMDSARFYFDKAQKLLEGKQYYEWESYYYKNRGRHYFVVNDIETAVDHFLKGLEALKKGKARKIANKQSIEEEDIFEEAIILNNIASMYSRLTRQDKAKEYLMQAKKVMDNNPNVNFKNYKPTILTSLAQVYMVEDQDEKALQLMEEVYKFTAAKAKDDIKEMAALANVLTLFTKYYDKKDNFGKVLEYGKQALEVAEEVNEKLNTNQARDLVNSANQILMYAYFKIKDYKTSTYYAERILELSSKSEFIDLPLIEAYQYLALNYAAMGNPKEALRCMAKYEELKKTRTDESIQKAVHEMEIKYETAEKQNEIENQKIELSRRKSQQIALISVLITITLLLILLIYIAILRKRRNRELAKMNATKDKFFSIISHDLKNPVIAQRDALQLLLDNVGKWDIESLTFYYHELLKSTDNQITLLFNLLNWAQVQTGRMSYCPTRFDLAIALRTDIALIKNIAAHKEITCEIQIPQNTIITADADMMVMVIRNLLTNAVKFTHRGGNVSLNIAPLTEVAHHTNIASNAPTKYRISISDTGVGMSAEQIEHLFHIDNTHSQAGTANEKGSGFGLLVCKELLEKHDSKLHIESVVGEGSKFWFEI